MNYYEHHLGDWAASTSHLTWDEDMAYTRLLRAYYHAEKAIPEGQQYRLAKAATPSQRRAVESVLAEFFTLEAGLYRQKRADAEIAKYHDKQRKAKASANARWSTHERNANALPAQGETDANALPAQCGGNALQTPDTRHQTREIANALSLAATATMAMRRSGLIDANPSHPELLALVEQGVTVEELSSAARESASRGKGFVYALRIAAGRRNDAANVSISPSAPSSANNWNCPDGVSPNELPPDDPRRIAYAMRGF